MKAWGIDTGRPKWLRSALRRKGTTRPTEEPPKITVLPPRFGLRDFTTLTLLCAAGYAGNLLSIPLFSGVDLLLGGVAVMFAALRLSLVETLLVALVASLHTLALWGHPYALVILVAEAAFVHLAVRRWRHEITFCDAGFWLVAGVPLILLFYAVSMDMDAVAVGTIVLKQPVNAVLYTAVASVIHHALLLRAHAVSRGGCRRGRFADLLAPALVLFALVPTLLMLGAGSHLQRQQNLDRAAAALSDARHRLSQVMTGAPRQTALENFHAWGVPIGPRRPAIAVVDSTGSPVAQVPDDWLMNRTESRAVAPDVTQRFPADTAAVMKRARDSYFTREVSPPAGFEGDVRSAVIGVAAAPYVDQLRTMQITGLALACGIGVVSVGGASIAARRAGRLLHPLVAQLEGVPRSVRAGERVRWRDSAVAEVAQLTDSARRMETDLAAQLDALTASERRFRAIADNLPGGVYERVMEPGGALRYSYLSPYYEHGLGLDAARTQRDPDVLIERMPPEDRAHYRAALARSARLLTPFDAEFRLRGPSGETRWLRSLGQPRRRADGAVIWHGIAIDETARKQAERELEYLARYDTVTGLLNRRALLRELDDLLDQVSPLAVLCIDLDGIKSINDTLGHAVGDQVVREAAARIQSAARTADRVGRYGGDEFAVVAVGIRDEAGAALAAERILSGLRRPMPIEGRQLDISATLGILLHPQPGDGAAESLRKADVALDQAKKEADGEWRFHTAAMDERLRRRAAFADDLRAAMRRDELYVEYQPKVDLASGRMIGVEALVRWQHPVEGIVPPDCFIPLAEESGLIEDLGIWVLRRACADLAGWRGGNPDEAPGHVSVNVSGRQFASNALWDAVWAELAHNDLAPDDLELEVTESVLYDAGAEMLERLCATGVGLAIDDYGKGYSSLLVMRDSPAGVVKIDRAFIGSALTNDDDRSIVASTIALAHALGRTVVAEGVETAAHLEMLQQMGCDMAQGFHFARPAPASDIPALARMVREHMGASWRS